MSKKSIECFVGGRNIFSTSDVLPETDEEAFYFGGETFDSVIDFLEWAYARDDEFEVIRMLGLTPDEEDEVKLRVRVLKEGDVLYS